MTRKGMALGTGRGYKNIVGKDPAVHSQSAKGMKQPQNVNFISHLRPSFKDEEYKGEKIIFIKLKGGMIGAKAPNRTSQFLGMGKSKEDAFNDLKKSADNIDSAGNWSKKEESKPLLDPISTLRGKQIVIKANRWFDKKYGNTYHSTEVYIDGKFIGREPFEYGYDEQYINTAFKILQKNNIIPTTKERLSSGMDKDFYDFMQFKRDNRDNVLTLVSDVGNKKDL